MDMTYQSTVRTVQIIVHMIVNSEEILVFVSYVRLNKSFVYSSGFSFFCFSPSK